MSKVLIDRAVLEATLEHAEFVSGAACAADDAIRAVLDTPSGTPVMPVKAYYHEAPNEYGGLNKSVGLEARKIFRDAPLVLESDALVQIAYLEGEIAKRDARIVELEEDLAGTQSRVLSLQNQWRKLDAELAAIKAHGVVMPEQVLSDETLWDIRNQVACNEVLQSDDSRTICVKHGRAIEAAVLARLNAAPVQQVSVPDGSTKMQWPEIVALVNEVLGCEAHKYPCEHGSIGHEMTGINFNSLARIIDRVHRLSAAAAAPTPGDE